MTAFKTSLPCIAVLAAATVLVACQPRTTDDAAAPATPAADTPTAPAAQGAHAVTGTATYRERIMPPPGASLRVQLLDNLLADTSQAVIAETTLKDVAGPPFAFALPFDASKLRPNGQYGLHASLNDADGKPVFVSDTRVPFDPAANTPVEILMVSASRSGKPAAPADASQTIATNWQCGDLRVGATFDNAAKRVTLSHGGRSTSLPLAMSGSGARYADEKGNEFWTKGDSGTLTLDGQKHECTQTQAASPWDAARARNIAFRAVGNEPGWLVEVGKGATPPLHAELDFGSRTLDIAQTQRNAQGDAWTGKTASGTQVELKAERTPCQDDSGARFDVTARLQAGGKNYTGCGAFLIEER
ncbi:YbaY family lipoprotein [Lysobacter sp. MMG2]|uniref:YbaY family lipoprotein n=1 Tax=Lysobacter sp. MMG2 TaxID=2801338 RepID=UPI001C24F0E3|nr:YbaY family lipoprotein [Lysobacter sp. MMG2]MBU8978225.1 YbaY family lipoprotein [Lysobacter sp. MMG2]